MQTEEILIRVAIPKRIKNHLLPGLKTQARGNLKSSWQATSTEPTAQPVASLGQALKGLFPPGCSHLSRHELGASGYS
jgi:hypothetical protein